MGANKRLRFLLYKSDPYSTSQPDGHPPTPICHTAPTGPCASTPTRRAAQTGVFTRWHRHGKLNRAGVNPAAGGCYDSLASLRSEGHPLNQQNRTEAQGR